MGKISGSNLIIKCLKAEGVETIFGIAGDHFLHLLDEMIDHEFNLIDGRHEAASVHMANAYSRLLRRPGVVMSTTPGHANAIAGLANALHSEAPVINIAGSAASTILGRGAMQEFDQVGTAKPVTKGSWEIQSIERIPEIISLAFRTAMSGRRGPVHITIPEDIQTGMVDEKEFDRYYGNLDSQDYSINCDQKLIIKALDILNRAKKPVIIAGAGAGATVNPKILEDFVNISQIPIFTVDHARGLVPDNHEFSCGLGYIPLNKALQRIKESDVVLLLGERLDYRWGYGGNPPFNDSVKQIIIDPDPSLNNRSRKFELVIWSDLGPAINDLCEKSKKYKWNNFDWAKSLKLSLNKHKEEMKKLAIDNNPMHPMLVSKTLSELIDDETIVIMDGGDYCHYFRAYLEANNPNLWLYVSSFGMIGAALPYSIGAQVAFPDKKVICVVGDGSLGFHAMDIDTAVRHQLPITIVVGNNSLWGIDYQIQKGIYGRTVWTELEPTRYDLVASGMGAKSKNVSNFSELKSSLSEALNFNGVSLLNIEVDKVGSPVAEAAISRKFGSHS